jgi:hypothetical protein
MIKLESFFKFLSYFFSIIILICLLAIGGIRDFNIFTNVIYWSVLIPVAAILAILIPNEIKLKK